MPWLTPVVFKQTAETLTELPRFGDGPKAVRFRHIVHAYKDKAVPVNTAIQSITFDTIRRAGQFCEPDYPVTCVAVTFPEDIDLVPADMVTATLQRVVTDICSFAVPRPLPLLFDVLHSGVSAPAVSWTAADESVEFLVMTNSDIHLQPTFYCVLGELIRQGFDVITVNRRTIDLAEEDRSFSPIFWVDEGREHPGFDCFVFPVSMLKSFVQSDSCCGAGQAMRSLMFNLVAHARRFLMLTRAHMTFHLGNDVTWQNPIYADYTSFNARQARLVISELAKDPEKAKRLADFITAHEGEEYRQVLPSITAASTLAL